MELFLKLGDRTQRTGYEKDPGVVIRRHVSGEIPD